MRYCPLQSGPPRSLRGQYISGGEKILQGKENATIFIDGTHIRIQRSSDYTTQKENYSGKKKFHSKNVLMITTNNGMIIGISRPFDGKTYDMKVLKNDFPDLGRWLESMKDPNTPKSERILVYSDTGYVGIEEVFPGIKSEQPTKKSKNRELTQEQKDENRLIGSERVTVEHPISHFAVLGGTFRGNTNHIFTYFLIASGIINIRIMFRDFELWAHMNRITSRMNIKPIPLPSDDLMKTAEYIEKTAGPKRELYKQQMAEWRKKTADARAAATP